MADTFPELTTKRLELKQITADLLPQITAGLTDRELTKYYGVSYDTQEETEEQMVWYRNLEESGTGIWWAIYIENSFCGAIGFSDFDQHHLKAEFGVWVLPNYWGRGIMLEAGKAVIEFGFEQLNIHRIEAFVEKENLNCKRGLDKLIFAYEGTMRECELKEEKRISIDIYSRLRA